MRMLHTRYPSVSLAVLLLCALPFLSCTSTTSMTPDPQAVQLQARAMDATTTGCTPSTNPYNPVLCVANDGTVNPSTITIHSHNNNNGNPIVWRTSNGANLTIALGAGCSTTLTLNSPCNGTTSVCNGMTIPSTTVNSCTYTASVAGGGSADPVIDTDACCPPPPPMPKGGH